MTEQVAQKPQEKIGIWRKMSRYSFIKHKLSTKNIVKLCKEYATDKPTLVVHSEDVNYKPYFPNGFAVTKRKEKPADMHVDLYYKELSKIPDESYEVIFCTGLLEHIPEPQGLINDFHRILKPGGKLIIGASAVFSFHECPNDFFHFTPFSFKLLFKDFSEIEMLRGSSQPFDTLSILLQRVLIQSDIFPPFRPMLELLCLILPIFDRFVIAQYDNFGHRFEDRRIDSMLPSNMHACIVK
ncbi:MAG TPA: methyltransferase domain-containing protein [Alphaproteobacteria bacterium]|nr:methyltransferase domain-containing protein [Alphaproteobacteria bacterium]